jgi:hypothetical protein
MNVAMKHRFAGRAAAIFWQPAASLNRKASGCAKHALAKAILQITTLLPPNKTDQAIGIENIKIEAGRICFLPVFINTINDKI